MASPAVAFRHDVEEERFDIVIQGLVIEEQLRKEAEILAVDLVLLAINLKHRYVAAAVDLIARRMAQIAFHLDVKAFSAWVIREAPNTLCRCSVLRFFMYFKQNSQR